MRTHLTTAFGLALLVGATAPLVGQTTDPDARSAAVGAELRQFKLGDSPAQTTIRQWSIPLGVAITRGRFGFDLGGGYASSELVTPADSRTVSGLTDTQIRGSYTFGRDALVASVVLNLPTGISKRPVDDFSVSGAISSAFFGFPVASYGNGFSATAGLAAAVPAGDWNLGLAGSVRVSSQFTPYSDPSGPITYKPGVEGRVRAGVDRIVGRSRITAGFTWSTFGTDQLAFGTSTAGLYQPGPRWLAEALAAVPVGGKSRLELSAWHYQRSAGDSVSVSVPNDERLSSAGAMLRSDLGRSVGFRIGIDGRLWHRGDSDGKLVGGVIGLGLPLGGRLSLSPEVRYDVGNLDPGAGSIAVRGLGASVFLRSTF